jgi:phytoene dehydrogenase-like protein
VTETVDVVVAGAGHNSLITAAYLAKAGYSCILLDARDVPGGGAATEEVLGDGFKFDTCSTGHTLIRANPVLRDDELGLIGEYGLEYIDPDPVAHCVFPDGEAFTMWLDLERTLEEIARFSKRDADAYRRMMDDYDAVKDAYGRYRFNPIGFAPSLEEMLLERPHGTRWLRRNAISAWDVISHEFESRHVQAFMLWMAYQTLQPCDAPGSGALAYSLVYGRQQRSWSLPAGGSGSLAAALVRALEDMGAQIICGKRVSSLVVEGGRCTGVETDDGERYMARHAVVSTMHVKDLVDMAPAEEWDDDFLYGIDTYDEGTSLTACYLQTTEAPRYPAAGGGGTVEVVSAGPAGWPEDVLRMGREVRQGGLSTDGSWLLFACPSIVDPSRVPETGGHTLKILSPQPYEVDGDSALWDERKHELESVLRGHLQRCAPNLTDDKIQATYQKSPIDIWKGNPHMWHGTVHGGDRGIAHGGKLRPAPGWAQHRMPISGLYQTGATTHPGGSITGAPGRNAAIVMLTDLGHDPAEVMTARKEVVG